MPGETIAMKICLIGASGFIGRRLLEQLSADPSVQIIAAMRRPPAIRLRPNVKARRIEALDRVSILTATRDATHIINCMMGRPEAMEALTRTLVEISAGNHIRRIIHFSSIAVYGTATGQVKEDAPLSAPAEAYGESKRRCEAMIAASPEAAKTVILRPALVGGAGSELWTVRIARLLRSRRLGDLGPGGDGLCNLVDVEDVVRACVLLLDHPGAGGRIYNLAMPDPPTWNTYFRDLAGAIGVTPLARRTAFNMRLETGLVAPALRILRKLAGKTPWRGMIPEPIPHGLADHFSRRVSYHSGAIEQETGFGYASYRELIANSAKGL